VRQFRNQITDAVHGMNARQNPLVRIVAIDPQESGLTG